MKYYIYNNKEIKIREQAVDTDMFTQYIEMTDSQVAFYLANPNASVDEIKNCKLLPTPPLPTLEEVKLFAIERLSLLSLEVYNECMPAYKFNNALMSIITNENTQNGIYDTLQATQIITTANDIGTLCRNQYYILKERIEACTTEIEVEAIEQEGIDVYRLIKINHETGI